MDYYVRLDTLLYILAGVMAVAAVVWVVAHHKFGKSILDMTLKIDREKAKYREMKQQMTNNIAHELRTPVSSIRGYLETLTTCPDIDPARKQIFIERAYAQSIRLSDLIRDIALITKIEEASSQLVKEKVNVREIMAEVLEEFKDKIADKGINIENMLPPYLEIEANRTLVFAIFRNLVENSLKYAGDHITIHIECSGRKSDLYQFKYYDTGKGVGREHLKRIFERFYRIQEGRTRDAGGSGLGLSIVRNAVLFHGGDISALAHHGGGLEYRFSLHA